MEQVNTNDNWDNYSCHLNLIFAAISALCSAKPMNASEFVSVVALIKEWPSNSPNLGILEFFFCLYSNNNYKNNLLY